MGQGPTMHWEQGQTGAWALFCPQSPCETVLSTAPPAPTQGCSSSTVCTWGLSQVWVRGSGLMMLERPQRGSCFTCDPCPHPSMPLAG